MLTFEKFVLSRENVLRSMLLDGTDEEFRRVAIREYAEHLIWDEALGRLPVERLERMDRFEIERYVENYKRGCLCGSGRFSPLPSEDEVRMQQEDEDLPF